MIKKKVCSPKAHKDVLKTTRKEPNTRRERTEKGTPYHPTYIPKHHDHLLQLPRP